MKWGKCIFIYLIFFHFFFMNNQKLFFTILFFFYFSISFLQNFIVISMVLKTGSDQPVRPVGPPTGHHSGSVRSLDRMETEPGLDRLNRRSNRWTGRFWGKKPVQIILNFFWFSKCSFSISIFQFPK